MWNASAMRKHISNDYDNREPLFDYNNREKIKASRVRDVPESHLRTEQSDMSRHARYVDNSSEIGEWLAQEEASLDRISLNCQKNDLFHENQPVSKGLSVSKKFCFPYETINNKAQSPPCFNRNKDKNFSNIYTSKINNNQG